MTSVDEAGALGMAADELVRTLVLDAASGHALAVLPATRRLDTKVAREAVGDRHAWLASEEALTRDFVGFESGALPDGIGQRSNRRSLRGESIDVVALTHGFDQVDHA